MIDKKAIFEVIQLPYDIFDVYVDTVIASFNFRKPSSKVRVHKFGIREQFNENINYKYFKFDSWKRDDNHTIFLSKSLQAIYEKYLTIENIRLKEIANVQRGTLPPKKHEKFVSKTGNISIKWFEHQVYRYKVDRAKEEYYINYNDLRENKDIELFKCKKILGRQLISRQFRMQFTYFDKEYAFKKNLYAIYNLKDEFSYFYLLSILNSRFYSYIQVSFNTSGQRDDFPSFSLKDYRNFLIPDINNISQQPFIEKVNKILTRKKAKPKADTTALESEIDKMVYELYGLTNEEIKIVENSKK